LYQIWEAAIQIGAKNALLCFPVRRVVPATPTELLRFQTFRVFLLVLRHGIVAFFAIRALQCDDVSHNRTLFLASPTLRFATPIE
jgi:hypothetical protein